MLKRIILSSALALLGSLHQTSYANDAPAWGLIVKLKGSAAEPDSGTANSSNSLAQAASINARTEASAQAAHAQMQATLQRAGLPQAAHRALIGTTVHHVGTDQILTHSQAQALASKLMASGSVEWAVPNEREHLQAALMPNDYYFQTGDQWWATEATGSNSDPAAQRRRGSPNMDLAWSISTGSSTPIVAVLDTGLVNHEDLNTARILPGQNFHHGIGPNGQPSASLDQAASNTTDPGDYLTQADKDANPIAYANCTVGPSSWHGTAVTGVIAATANGSNNGIAGGDWAVRILPVRIAGKCGAWETDIIDAMNWVAGDSNGGVKRADVINLSFGGTGTCDNLYQQAINHLRLRGVVVVIAAGNDHGSVARPANCTGVVAVSALNRDGFKTYYSNFGPQVTISTVGGDSGYYGAWGPYLGDSGIYTLTNTGTTSAVGTSAYDRYAGTSLAAPIVSATVSLMLSVNPSLSVDSLILGLQTSARPHVTSALMGSCSASNPGRCICTTQTCGSGILDAYRALQYASNPTLLGALPPTGENIDSAELIYAHTLNSQDMAANPTSSVTGPPENKGGGGGGGSSSLLALLGLTVATGLAARQVKAQAPRTA